MTCIFCKINSSEIPAEKLYEDEHCFTIADKYPKAPHHYLFITKEHISSVSELVKENDFLAGHLLVKAKEFAQKNNIAGYKLQFNVNAGGGQEVFHIHLHLLGFKD